MLSVLSVLSMCVCYRCCRCVSLGGLRPPVQRVCREEGVCGGEERKKKKEEKRERVQEFESL